MVRHVLWLKHYLKILWSVIMPVSVYVVDDFTREQRPSKHLLSNDAMLMPTSKLYIFMLKPAVSIFCNNHLG